jgi:hypothetical protein
MWILLLSIAFGEAVAADGRRRLGRAYIMVSWFCEVNNKVANDESAAVLIVVIIF